MSQNQIKDLRAELLVEDFLSRLKPPHFVEVAGGNLDFDYVVALKRSDGGLKYIAIEVKQTDNPVSDSFPLIRRGNLSKSSNSNMPTVLVVADTKRNDLYYGFISEAKVTNRGFRAGVVEVSVPVEKVVDSSQGRSRVLRDFLAKD